MQVGQSRPVRRLEDSSAGSSVALIFGSIAKLVKHQTHNLAIVLVRLQLDPPIFNL